MSCKFLTSTSSALWQHAGRSRRAFAKQAPSAQSTEVDAVPLSSLSGKPSFRPRKLPAGRKRIPQEYLLPRDKSERPLREPKDRPNEDEEREHKQWLADLHEMNASLKGISFSKSEKSATAQEEDAKFVEKFMSEAPEPESILPDGFFKTQQEIAKKKILTFPTHRSLSNPFVQRMRHDAKREELMVDAEGNSTIYGFRVPGELAGYYEDPKGYRQEKAIAYEAKMQKLRQRSSKKKKLVSSWRVDPEQPNFTRRQLRMSSKIKSTLENVIDDFIEKHAPILLSEGGIDIKDVTVTKDMRVATIVWESQMPEADVKRFLDRHLSVLRYQLTQALQPQKWSPEIVLKSAKEVEKEREPERENAQLLKSLESEVSLLEKEIAEEEGEDAAESLKANLTLKQKAPTENAPAKQAQKPRDDHISRIAKQMARNLVLMAPAQDKK